MKWGETQNLVSVIIGLNIAYYAFKEIRTPHLAALKRRVDQLEKNVKRRMDDLGLVGGRIPGGSELRLALLEAWDPIMDLRDEVDLLIDTTPSPKVENLLSISAMIVAVLATVFLIVSTVKYEDGLSLSGCSTP